MLYTLRFFFSSKFNLFHNANFFGSCIIHILYTGCAKLKKNNYSSKGLKRAKNNRYFTRRPTHIFNHISLRSSKNEKYFR